MHWWMRFSPGIATADIDTIFKMLARRLPTMIRATLESQQQETVLPMRGKFAAVQATLAHGRDHESGRLSLRARASR